MMKKLLLISAMVFLAVPVLQAQTKQELREKIAQNEQEIQTANDILDETKASRKSTMNELYVLQKRIDLRDDLINNLNQQIDNIEQQIRVNQKAKKKLQSDLKKLKDQYARIIKAAYKHHKGFDRLMFLLSSESFNQAYKRYKYLHQYAKYRRNQASKIKAKAEKLEYKIQEFKSLKNDKKAILSQKQSEKYKLRYEKRQVRKKIGNLKEKEEELRKDITSKKKMIAQLEEEIQRIIEEEKEETNVWSDLSESQKRISAAFEKNKGSLPWPITNGIITQEFGEHGHPVLEGVKLNNNGVDISTTRHSKVKCLFDGIARRVVSIPGANLTVIVRHGNYLSVYSNLVDVNVEPGDRIAKGQVIGQVYNDQESNKNVLHLEIYHENQKLNPEKWLE